MMNLDDATATLNQAKEAVKHGGKNDILSFVPSILTALEYTISIIAIDCYWKLRYDKVNAHNKQLENAIINYKNKINGLTKLSGDSALLILDSNRKLYHHNVVLEGDLIDCQQRFAEAEEMLRKLKTMPLDEICLWQARIKKEN